MDKLVINKNEIEIENIEIEKNNIYILSKEYNFNIFFSEKNDFRNINVGEEKDWYFEECTLSVNNEASLIFPTTSKITRTDFDEINIYIEFNDLEKNNNIVYMNRKEKYDINDIKIYLTVSLAKEYSEGSKQLEECLLELWDNNFETIGCCKGHTDKIPPTKAYIGFKFNNNDTNIKFLSSLDKENIIITFVSQDHKKSFAVKELDKPIYDNIKDSLNKDVIDSKVKEIFDFMNNYNDTDYINIRLHYRNDNYKLYINTCNKNIIEKLKLKYNCEILNDKINLYHFRLLTKKILLIVFFKF